MSSFHTIIKETSLNFYYNVIYLIIIIHPYHNTSARYNVNESSNIHMLLALRAKRCELYRALGEGTQPERQRELGSHELVKILLGLLPGRPKDSAL